MNIITTIKTLTRTAYNWGIEHSPELLLGTSIVAGVGATVTGCIATKKMEEINAKHKEILDILHQKANEGVIEDGVIKSGKESSEYKKELTKEYGRYWFEVGKTWTPCVALTLLSGTCAYGSFKVVHGRLIKAEMAFAGIAKAFEQYRDNVIEDQGVEKDAYYANNGALKKKQELIKAGKYKEKALPGEPTIQLIEPDKIFRYIFSEDTVKWGYYSNRAWYNFNMLTQAQTMFDHQLRQNGVLLLDDVYTYLGLDLSNLYAEKAQGRTYGWTLDCYAENGMPNDQHVLFGIYENNDTAHRLFRAGDITDVTLEFNARLLTKETCELLAKG